VTDPIAKVLTLTQLIDLRSQSARDGRRFVLTNGCFDLLHPGHVSYLFDSSQLGDFLAVAINSDASVRQLKGEGRPVNCESDRAYVVAALGCVGATFVFEGPRLAAEIRALKPDVYTKAGDYTLEGLERSEREALLDVGAEIRFMPFKSGHSTTSLLSRGLVARS